jgi:hypothetical protein
VTCKFIIEEKNFLESNENDRELSHYSIKPDDIKCVFGFTLKTFFFPPLDADVTDANDRIIIPQCMPTAPQPSVSLGGCPSHQFPDVITG